MSKNIKKNKSMHSRYRPEIDGLRAFAVIAVIINHFNKDILPNGYLGVDIFFVISGFVITSSLYQRPSKNFKDFIIGFYERRVKRLVPALSFFVLIMSITICFFNEEPVSSLRTGLTSLFGLSNIYLLKHSTDYFAQSTEFNVFTHTWSLGVEEQFYIIFPFLIWFSGFGRHSRSGARNLFLIIGLFTICSLTGFLYLYPINQSAAYFLMPTRFWEMASGCLLFISFQKRKSIEQLLGKFPPLLATALIIGVMYLPNSLGRTSTIAVVVLSSILIASLKERTKAYKFFTSSKVVYIGLISYSLYLWHWGILSISRWTIGIHWWSLPFQIALIFGLAITSYKYIETPVRKSYAFNAPLKRIIFGGLVITSLSVILITLDRPLKGQLYMGKRILNARPNFIQGEKCLENISIHTFCYLVENKSQETLWIIGDSHARHLAFPGEQVANSSGMNLKLYTANGIPFPPILRYRKSTKNNDLESLADFKLVEQELYDQIKFGDVILLSMRMPYHFGGTYYGSQPSDFIFIKKDGSFGSQENYFNEWISSVKNLANIAQKKGSKVIIQTPTPEWQEEWKQALDKDKSDRLNKSCSNKNEWFNKLQKRNCQIRSNFFIDEEKGLYRDIFKKLNQLSNSHENIYLFDTYQVVCPGIKCSFNVEGVDIYKDSDHLSHIWSKDFLSPEIYKFITSIKKEG